MKKNKSFQILFIFFLTVFLVSVFVILFFFSNRDIEIIDVSFVVDENPAFDLNKSILSFGKVIPGTSVSRNIILENKRDYPVYVFLKSSRSLESVLFFEKEILLNSYEKKKISISLSLPPKYERGNYTGELVVVVKK